MKTNINKTEGKNRNSSPFFKHNSNESFFGVQPKLAIGKPDDQYETEADRVAETVVNFSGNQQTDRFFSPQNSSLIQQQPDFFIHKTPFTENITPGIQAQSEEEDEKIQKKAETSGEHLPSPESSIIQNRGNGASLDSDTKLQMESGFGASFENVKIHTDRTAIQLNTQLGAQAFTAGNDIYFNNGKYQPQLQNGKKLLAHELTHTIQQGDSNLQTHIQREGEPGTEPDTAVEDTTEPTECDENSLVEETDFHNHGIFGPQSFSPTGTNTGGFEASYDPDSEILNISVRGKTRFVDGLSLIGSGLVTSHETDLSGLARLLSYIGDETLSNTVVSDYYTWNETQKETARINFQQRIEETVQLWQDRPNLMFILDEPCWSDIFANVNINVDVQDAGDAAYSGRNDNSNDHLQVTLVKNPERSEMQAVRSLIQTTAQRIGDTRLETIDTSAGLTTGASVSSNRNRGTDATDPYNSEMTLSNQSLENTPTEVNNFNRSMLRTKVYFANNETILDDGDKRSIDQFARNFREADSNRINSKVKLIGHASQLGSTSANAILVRERLNSVMSYLREIGFPEIETRVSTENDSDRMAERFDDTENNAAYFRSVELVVGEGELQNTVAHEFGHVFGLVDEYVTEEGVSFNGTGTPAGTEVAHSDMSEDIGAGTALSESSDNMMSMGNAVRDQHYGPFGWALKQLTHKDWLIS